VPQSSEEAMLRASSCSIRLEDVSTDRRASLRSGGDSGHPSNSRNLIVARSTLGLHIIGGIRAGNCGLGEFEVAFESGW
jgi:hypothetical protein